MPRPVNAGVRPGNMPCLGVTEFMKRIFILTLFVIEFQAVALAQDKDACASFQQTVKSTYNFRPSRLTESERNSKSTAMDRFWEMVKADPKPMEDQSYV